MSNTSVDFYSSTLCFSQVQLYIEIENKANLGFVKKKKKILGFLLAFRIHFYSSSDLDAFDFQVPVIMLER